MKLTSILPVLFWIAAIAVGNYQIVSSTNQKIVEYHNNPPFRIGSLQNPSHLLYLLDSQLDTIWERKNYVKDQADFFIEMKLTHYYDGSSFVPFQVNGIQWIACPDKTLPKFNAKLFLRESINVDKELRLPEDKLVSSFEFREFGKLDYIKNIDVAKNLLKQSNYPTGIYIYTLEMTLPEKISENDCFAEIRLRN